MLEFIPKELRDAVVRTGIENVYELRVRADSAVTANVRGKYVYFGKNGIESCEKSAFSLNEREIADMIYSAGNFSVYAVEEQLRRGFITAYGGVRLGIAGEYVFENGKVCALKRATSLCIRIPHRVPGSSNHIYHTVLKNKLKNILILSAPGRGKTTILRDLAEKLTDRRSDAFIREEANGANNAIHSRSGEALNVQTSRNVLICDERGEITACGSLKNADVISYVDKDQAFTMAIRGLRPDLIITDELSEEDCTYVKRAIRSGAYVIASAHFHNVQALSDTFKGIFDVYAVLSDVGIGNIEGVYDKHFNKLKIGGEEWQN